MWHLGRAMGVLATFIVAAALVSVFAWLPPILGFVLAVAAAIAWCAMLDSADWPSGGVGVTMSDADRTPMRASKSPRPLPYLTDGRGIAAAVIVIAALTSAFRWTLHITDPTTVALSFLLVVVVLAAVSSWRVAVATSLAAFFTFNFFFLPPTGTFVVADTQHWVALFTLLFVSLAASYLSSEIRHRADEVLKAEVARNNAELKSSLLASLGHDLKTPLTALTVAANNLNASWLSDAQRLEQAEVVRQELARLNRLFQNLIDLARIELRAVAAEPEWVSPADIVEAASRQVAGVLAHHPLQIDASDELLVRLDPRLTSAALAHVLENAAQHSPAGAPVVVTVTPKGNELWLAVRDHGKGLSSGRPIRSPTAPRAGTGLGLTISRGLLSAEGGRVWGEDAPGGGAVFTIAVPIESRPAAELAPELA
jgi:two-component system sensor histidine kinase KdpD